ncbi:MAG: hypothetical protein U0575_03595 [Phycisphaerales bacterium]
MPKFELLATLSLVLSTGASAQSTIGVYDAGKGLLPTDVCWTLNDTTGGAVPIVNVGGSLAIGPTTTAGVTQFQVVPKAFSFDDGASIAARVFVTSSTYLNQNGYQRAGYYIGLRDGIGRYALLGIASDRVLLATEDFNPTDQTYAFNTTGAFHVYKLAFSGDTVQAIIDDVVVLTDDVGNAGFTYPTIALFGDASIVASSTTETAWVQAFGVYACPSADLDGDCAVGGADLGLLLAAWGTTDCLADLNFDGMVDGADLGALLSEWG